MAGDRSRQLRRQRQRTERQRAAKSERARAADRARAEAEARGGYDDAQRRHRIAYGIWVVAAFFALTHLFEHLNVMPPLTGSSGLDDLVVGWPMAGVLAIVGAIRYGT